MSKMRSINTKFWDDSYIITLDPHEKLLFLYFLTSPLTNICGAYEISVKRICFDTGLEEPLVQHILEKLSTQDKITYQDGWLVIHNFIKNQSLNPKVVEGIKLGLDNAPIWVKDRLSIDYASLSHSNSNSNSNSNINSNSNTPHKKKYIEDQNELKKLFWENPLFPKLKAKYPDRDYEFLFAQMCAWYLDKKKRLPQMISAFSNWLEGSKPDEGMRAARLRAMDKEAQDAKQKEIQNTPRADPKKMEELRKNMKNIGKKI